jgi:hypothetical protein
VIIQPHFTQPAALMRKVAQTLCDGQALSLNRFALKKKFRPPPSKVSTIKPL